jgi:hypothetical protein
MLLFRWWRRPFSTIRVLTAVMWREKQDVPVQIYGIQQLMWCVLIEGKGVEQQLVTILDIEVGRKSTFVPSCT